MAAAGDVLGWFDSAGGAIGFENDINMRHPIVVSFGQTQPSVGGANLELLDQPLAYRTYGLSVCYSKCLLLCKIK